MATEIRMPQLGVSMEYGTIFQWFKSKGEEVKAGEVIASINTEKLTSDIVSEVDGIVLAIIAEEGEDVPVQGLIAVIGQHGEVWNNSNLKVESEMKEQSQANKQPEINKKYNSSFVAQDSVKASPLARKVAAGLGIDLTEVKATGTTGRIKEKDVLAYAKGKTTSLNQMQKKETFLQNYRGKRVEKMSNMRYTISKRMCNSLQTNAQASHLMSVDMTEAINIREKYNEAGIKVSYNDIIVRIVSKALMDMPIINASVDGTNIIYHDYVNVGIAVSVLDGLFVPVIKDADLLSIVDINKVSRELIKKAQENTLSEMDCSGGTFTVSSLGMFDVDSFTAIINPPESAILAVGKIAKTPVVIEDKITIRPICNLTLSYDHRIIDGAEAAKFQQLVKKYLQDPLLLL